MSIHPVCRALFLSLTGEAIMQHDDADKVIALVVRSQKRQTGLVGERARGRRPGGGRRRLRATFHCRYCSALAC